MRALILSSRQLGARLIPEDRPTLINFGAGRFGPDGMSLEDQVLELWFGGFDTFTIADALQEKGLEITQADAANIVAREMDRRYAARQRGGANA